MKISYNWLKQYINFDLTPEVTSTYLTNCGLEVEAIEKFESVKGGLNGLVIGEVLTCINHPDSDHLHIATVKVGNDQVLNIVCGAPNIRAELKVVVATVGAVLYSGDESFTIKKSKIRGALSEGMICSEIEIGLGNAHEGIMELPADAIPGTLAAHYFNIEVDFIFEIGITPNRSDAISHFGVARDLYAILNVNGINCTKPHLSSIADFLPSNRKPPIKIKIENKIACPRYSGICMEDVVVKESPNWLKNRLMSVGIRPINNIVDITQFVMLETGQPLHAFDSDKIDGRAIIVKTLTENTPFITLEGVEIKLHADDLMICNLKKGMCIAGVFGGRESGITEKTKEIFLESAYFNPVSVRKTSKRHGLKTNAAFRYERGCDPNITVFALRRATQLLIEYADAVVTSELLDEYHINVEPHVISLAMDDVKKIIGKKINIQIASSILLNLGFETATMGNNNLSVTVPLSKHDISRPIDLIEEILRIYGYNNVPIPSDISYQPHSKPELTTRPIQKSISLFLANNGFFEMMNNSLTNAEFADNFDFINEKERVDMVNPLSSELNALRQTLLLSGLETIARNLNNKNNNLKLFEFGKTYHLVNKEDIDVIKRFEEKELLSLFSVGKTTGDTWNLQSKEADFYFLKNYVENILFKHGIDLSILTLNTGSSSEMVYYLEYCFGEQIVAKLGRVDDKVCKYFGIKKTVYYAVLDFAFLFTERLKSKSLFKQIAVTPAVKRDLALVVDKSVPYQLLEKIAYQFGTSRLKNVSLFDIYEGEKLPENKKQYALNFVLQHQEKTLTDEEIQKTMQKLISAFERECGAQLR